MTSKSDFIPSCPECGGERGYHRGICRSDRGREKRELLSMDELDDMFADAPLQDILICSEDERYEFYKHRYEQLVKDSEFVAKGRGGILDTPDNNRFRAETIRWFEETYGERYRNER